jgi:hypothetical protein
MSDEARAHSYAGDSKETFDSFVALARRSVAILGHDEVVHRHRHGEACVPGCTMVLAFTAAAADG